MVRVLASREPAVISRPLRSIAISGSKFIPSLLEFAVFAAVVPVGVARFCAAGNSCSLICNALSVVPGVVFVAVETAFAGNIACTVASGCRILPAVCLSPVLRYRMFSRSSVFLCFTPPCSMSRQACAVYDPLVFAVVAFDRSSRAVLRISIVILLIGEAFFTSETAFACGRRIAV